MASVLKNDELESFRQTLENLAISACGAISTR